MTIEKKVEDMTPIEMLNEIHKKEIERLGSHYKGKNSCPKCSGYIIYIKEFKISKCYRCGYNPNEK